MSTKGISDLPVDGTTDTLNINGLLSTLTDYIASCETPLTISIQGAWGSGKTSAMNAVRHKLEAVDSGGVWSVFFNTWQYSQFDLGEELSLSLIRTLLSELELRINEDRKKFEKARELIKKILSGLPSATLKTTSELALQASLMSASMSPPIPLAVPAALGAAKAIETFSEKMGEAVADRNVSNQRILLVDTLKKNFGDLVESVCTGETDAPKRIVVFIDDLDRLSPLRAVELLEAIKIFLDVRHCVFVLAIDFDVVRQGVDEKFGKSLGDEKARAFFDKIIQVPFNLPVGRYDVRAILESAVEFSEVFVGLIDDSVGRNPRAVKRLVNQFILLRDIALSAGGVLSARDEVDIFAFLCFEAGFPWVYRDFQERVRHEGSESAFDYFFRHVERSEYEQLDEVTRSLWRLTDAYSRFRLLRFSKRIGELFGEAVTVKERARRLDVVLRTLAVTMNDSVAAEVEQSAVLMGGSTEDRCADLKRRRFIAESVQRIAAAFDRLFLWQVPDLTVQAFDLLHFTKWCYDFPLNNFKAEESRFVSSRSRFGASLVEMKIAATDISISVSAVLCSKKSGCETMIDYFSSISSDLSISSNSEAVVISGIQNIVTARLVASALGKRVLSWRYNFERGRVNEIA